MAISRVCVIGAGTIGSLYAGSLVNGAGAAVDLVVSGAIGILATAGCAFALFRRPRPAV